MRDYETLFVLKADTSDEDIAAIIAKVTAIIEADGEVESVDEWGKRKLAYTIDKKYSEGHYVLINFKAETSVLPNLEHLFRITDAFIRDIIVNRDDVVNK